ncbi:MAG: hypothetical protein QGF56_06785 [Verrucomicrobiota bacterium]|nr:hypothetical protein [Verrucomicrobiota bacterium]MDP6753378.1 hypothetical protein [Verrucomicrobiota bacterium]
MARQGYLFVGAMKKWTTILSGIAAGVLFAGCGGGDEAAAVDAAADPNVIAYPLETCLVADKKLGSMGKPHTFVHEGREIKFCCEGCDDEFKTNTAKYLKKFDAAVAANAAAAK